MLPWLSYMLPESHNLNDASYTGGVRLFGMPAGYDAAFPCGDADLGFGQFTEGSVLSSRAIATYRAHRWRKRIL